MLSEREVHEIEEARRRGIQGPAMQAWVEKLLADRRERLEQLGHARQRLNQAYLYLDRLLQALEPVADAAPGRDIRKRQDRERNR